MQNSNLLQNPYFVNEIKTLLLGYANAIPDINVSEYWDVLKNTIQSRAQSISTSLNKQLKNQENILEEAKLTKTLNIKKY